MQDIQPTSTQLLDNEKSDLQTAIKVICESKQDFSDDIEGRWAEEAFDFVATALKEKEAMQ